MVKDITKELLETIKQTLPETQVGLIKDALVERDELRKEVETIKESKTKLFEDFKKLDEQNTELLDQNQDVDQKLNTARTHIAELQKMVTDYEKKDVERRAEIAEGKLQAVQETQQLFLRNTIVREKIQSQVPLQGTSVQTQYVNGQPVQVPSTYSTLHPATNTVEKTTDSEEETKNDV